MGWFLNGLVGQGLLPLPDPVLVVVPAPTPRPLQPFPAAFFDRPALAPCGPLQALEVGLGIDRGNPVDLASENSFSFPRMKLPFASS